MLLSLIRDQEWKSAENIPLLEESVRLDERQPGAYCELGYAYRFAGDLPRALSALDRHASLLPLNDWNSIDSRGDVLVTNERYEEALAAYFENRGLNRNLNPIIAAKITLTYLLAGQYSLAEANAGSMTRWSNSNGNQAITASMSGSLVRPNFLAYTLGHFYLGRVLEQTGGKADAIDAYRKFLGHFENSSAKLQQIAGIKQIRDF